MAGQRDWMKEDIQPVVQFKTYYYIMWIVAAVFMLVLPGVPLALFVPVSVASYILLFLGLPLLVIFLFTFWWIGKYYQTMKYKLTGHEMTWRRGVWFRNTGIVPYNRITNVDITQGPISRALGIASLRIQTAGYSASKAASSEISIEGIKEFEDLREFIMGMVRGGKAVAVESYQKEDSTVLEELVRIRKLLEKKR